MVELTPQQTAIIFASFLVVILFYNEYMKKDFVSSGEQSHGELPFMEPVPDPDKQDPVAKRGIPGNRLGNRGFRCSQTERKPTFNEDGSRAMQDVIENLYQKTVNKVTTNLAGFNRQDAKKTRELKLKASLRPEHEPASFHQNEVDNVYSKASFNKIRDMSDRLKQSATRMQNDVPISEFTTRLGSATGASGAPRFLHGVREVPHVPLTKGGSSLRAVGGDIQTNALGLGINKNGFSRENYSNIGLIDRNPKDREYDGTNRFFKSHQKEGGTKNNRLIEGINSIVRFGDYVENAVEMSRGVNRNVDSPFIGEVHQRGYKHDGLHNQRKYAGRNTENAFATKISRGEESRDLKPETIIGNRHWIQAKAVDRAQLNPANIYTEYEHSYK